MRKRTELSMAPGELPLEAIIPARLVLANDDFDRLVRLIENPPAPTRALCELMHPIRVNPATSRD